MSRGREYLGRERLLGSLRDRRESDDELDDVLANRGAPGKRKAREHDPGDQPAAAPPPVASGVRVHRWAERGDDAGATGGLAAALGVAGDSHATRRLPAALARRFHAELGVDVSDVRIHDDQRAHHAAAEICARAFTIGDDIYFAAGAYDPTSPAGVELIAHEIAHVAQQRRGTAPTSGGMSSPGDAHEREAGAFASRFRQHLEAAAQPGRDPAALIEHARRDGQRIGLPFQAELEDQLGTSLDFVETFTGPAAQLACEALGASALAIRNLILLADPSPARELLLHELTHVQQMGQRGAPAKFAIGTLKVSRPDDAAEVEARSGGPARVAADPDTVHRADAGDKVEPANDGKAADQRIKLFLDDAMAKLETYPKTAKDGEQYHAFRDPVSGHRYTRSSKAPWNRDDYAKVVDASPLKRGGRTYTNDLAAMKAPGTKQSNRIANVTDQTWAFIIDDPWVDQVDDIRPNKRKEAKPEDQFKCYFNAIRVLKPKGVIIEFDYPDNEESYKQANCTFTPESAKAYREAMRESIARGYAAKGKAGWEAFYVDVMGGETGKGLFPANYNGVTGSIFERIVRLSTGKSLRKEKPLFASPLLDQGVEGDDVAFQGQVIIDAKGAHGGIVVDQCKRYNLIITQQIPGYFARESEEDKAQPRHYYKAVAYTFPGTVLADKAKRQLEGLFPDDPGLWNRFHISPNPADLTEFLLTFNPTIRLVTKDKGKSSYQFNAPPSLIPGVTIKHATIKANPKAGQVTGGSVDMAIDMGGAFKNEHIRHKPITPAADGKLGGSVDNKFTGFKSSLDKVLGAATVDARLVDGGVEATVTMKPGAARIRKFQIDGAVLTARYINGALTIDGEVGLTHSSKKISGSVKVAWEGNSWSFDGQATLAEGLVPGLSAVTLGIRYARGKTTLYCPQASYQRKIGNIDLKGSVRNLEYEADDGGFSGDAELEADLGMFGKANATATLARNELKNASFSYDSPELKYPANSDNPAFKGTVGGTIKYDHGKFSGAIRGAANLNIPGLKAIAGESGVGLSVDAHLHGDGSYSGTVANTSTLTFGKHIEVPRFSCTLARDGALSGDFKINIVKIKHLENATIQCSVKPGGIAIEDARIEVSLGEEAERKFGGTLWASYTQSKGLEIGGQVNYKIKEGMVAIGTLSYSTQTHEVSLEMTVKKITVLDKDISKTLFKASKQIPVVNVMGLGVYIDIGFELGFDFGFYLSLSPTVTFEGLSLETFEFKQIAAKLEMLGLIHAQLTGTPKLGIGAFALDPRVLRGGGGLKMPIVGRAEIKPTGTLGLSYSPQGGVSGDAKLGMAMTFGITGSIAPYAEFSVLDGLWNPTWDFAPLTDFEILSPRELFNFTLDLGGDMTEKEPPALPEENAAKQPTPPEGDRELEESHGAATERGEGIDKDGKPEPVPKEGGDEGPFSLSSLFDKLKGNPEFASAEKLFQIAKGIWNWVQPVWELVEPLFDMIGDRIDAYMDLLQTELPRSAGEILPWVWKLAKKVLNLAFDGITDFARAILKMVGRLVDFALKLISRAIQEGWIGVKRHSYYIWRPWPWDNYEFMAAAEYKINIPGVVDLGPSGPDDFLLTPSGAVSLCLYEALDATSIPYTYRGNSDINEPYNDYWTGAGARG